jgi:hypothetical protein
VFLRWGPPPAPGGAAVVHDGDTSVFTVNAADHTPQETYVLALGQPWHTQ